MNTLKNNFFKSRQYFEISNCAKILRVKVVFYRYRHIIMRVELSVSGGRRIYVHIKGTWSAFIKDNNVSIKRPNNKYCV